MSIDILPNEILCMISEYLNTRELYQFSKVNQLCNDISRQKLDDERKLYMERKEEVEKIADSIYRYMMLNSAGGEDRQRYVELMVSNIEIIDHETEEERRVSYEKSQRDLVQMNSILRKMKIDYPFFQEAMDMDYGIVYQLKLSTNMKGIVDFYTVNEGLVMDEKTYEFNVGDFYTLLCELVYHNITVKSSRLNNGITTPTFVQFD